MGAALRKSDRTGHLPVLKLMDHGRFFYISFVRKEKDLQRLRRIQLKADDARADRIEHVPDRHMAFGQIILEGHLHPQKDCTHALAYTELVIKLKCCRHIRTVSRFQQIQDRAEQQEFDRYGEFEDPLVIDHGGNRRKHQVLGDQIDVGHGRRAHSLRKAAVSEDLAEFIRHDKRYFLVAFLHIPEKRRKLFFPLRHPAGFSHAVKPVGKGLGLQILETHTVRPGDLPAGIDQVGNVPVLLRQNAVPSLQVFNMLPPFRIEGRLYDLPFSVFLGDVRPDAEDPGSLVRKLAVNNLLHDSSFLAHTRNELENSANRPPLIRVSYTLGSLKREILARSKLGKQPFSSPTLGSLLSE